MDASDASLAPAVRAARPTTSGGFDYTTLIEVDPTHYVIGGELARGGMGRIVRARDRRLSRDVAIKELLPRHDDLRFEREARITARLAHPAIVAIHEAGRWPNGSPFFAMKLVAGESLDKVILAKASFKDRLELVGNVITAVEALAYAHNERVIHRDLKPANILVGKYGETVVIDWGLAKDLDTVDETVDVDDPDYEPKEGETVVGAVMGTPQYMSPEQADGARVDARTDVYALGALLYHVLAGGPPYEGKSTAEVLQRVLAEPPRSLAQCAPETPMELIAIVERAMERDTKIRFQNAGEMAEELRRFQTGQLIKSHRYTARELVRRWVKRNRTPLAVAAIALVALATIGVASIVKIVNETHRADDQAAIASERADRGTIERARNLLDQDPTQAVAALRELSHGSAHWREARMIVADAVQRGTARVFQSDGGVKVSELAWNAEGTRLAAIVGGELMAWDLGNGAIYRLPGPTSDPQQSIGWDGDDVVHVDQTGVVSRWHALRGGNDLIGAFDGEQFWISPNGRWIVIVDGLDDGTAVELATKKRRALGSIRASDSGLRVVGWAANSASVVAVDSRSAFMRHVTLATGATTYYPLSEGEEAHAVAAFGARVIATSNQRPLFAAESNTELQTGFTSFGAAVAALPDGRVIAIASNASATVDAEDLDDNAAQPFVWISDGTSTPWKLDGHRTALTALAVSLRGQVATADYRGGIRVWARAPIRYSSDPRRLLSAFVDPNRLEIVAMNDDVAERINLASGTLERSETRRDLMPRADMTEGERDPMADQHQLSIPDAIVTSTSGERWVTRDSKARSWSWNHMRPAQLCGTKGSSVDCNVQAATVSADGSRAAALVDDHLEIYDREGTRLPIESPSFDLTTAIALSSSGRTVAVAARIAGEGNNVFLYDEAGKATGELSLHASSITAMMWSDETHLCVAFDSAIQVIDVKTRARRALEGHEAQIAQITFTADGRMITTSADNTARIWNLVDGSSRVLRGHTKRIRTVDVVGDRAVTTSLDGTARLWDLATEQSRTLPVHAEQPLLAAISASGDIVVLDIDGRLSHYTDNVPWGEAALRGWIDALTNLRN